MTRMTGPDCVVMCNLINTHTHIVGSRKCGSSTRSGQSRVYRVTQLRTDGIYSRESAGTGPVNLKVVPVTGAALTGAPLFSTCTIYWYDVGHVDSIGVKCVCVVGPNHPMFNIRSCQSYTWSAEQKYRDCQLSKTT